MSKRLYRELYLLSRGEQRALLLLSLLLILSLVCRILAGMIPGREPPGMEEFIRESRMVMAAMVQQDSLRMDARIQLQKSDSIKRSKSGSTSNTYRPAYQANQTYQSKNLYPVHSIDLNRADSVQLLPLPGIGPVFARRIIKYRDLLGGYASLEQLKEVYGMKEETFDLIGDHLLIDTSVLRRMDLNSATFRHLLKHPYLEYEDVKVLLNYRDVVGYISSSDEIREHGLLADSIFERIAPYLEYPESGASSVVKE
jgi:competence protein ComEA